MSKSKWADMGKWAEGEVAGWLEAKSASTTDFAWHRFPDARAARGALAAQPSDFLVVQDNGMFGIPVFVEVKETKQVSRLPKSKISQFGKLKMFHLAGADVLVIVYRSELKDWTYFNGHELFEDDSNPASFAFIKERSYMSHVGILEEVFQ